MKRSLLKKRKIAEKIVFQLLYDYGAGEYRVRELMGWETEPPLSQDELLIEVGVYNSKKELNAAIEDLKEKLIFACSDEWFISKEDNCSKNWRGSKHDPFTFIRIFDTREEAEKYVSQ